MTKKILANRRVLLQGAVMGAGLVSWGLAEAATPAGKDLFVIAEIVGKPEKADELRGLIVPFAAKARKEPGVASIG